MFGLFFMLSTTPPRPYLFFFLECNFEESGNLAVHSYPSSSPPSPGPGPASTPASAATLAARHTMSTLPPSSSRPRSNLVLPHSPNRLNIIGGVIRNQPTQQSMTMVSKESGPVRTLMRTKMSATVH